MSNKRIFITGGAGFIGSAVIHRLQSLGHDIFVYDNLSFGKRSFIDVDDNNFYEGDILNFETLSEQMRLFNPHYVVHLAAIHFIPYCNEHPFESANINIAGTLNVLESVKVCRYVEKVFFASTAAVYPIMDKAIPETTIPKATDIYGLSKLAGEKLCSNFYLETKTPTIICRFFNAFGPNETNPHLIPAIENQVKAGIRTLQLGNLLPKRDFIHTSDMANAVALLLQHFNEGCDVFNLGQGIEYSVTEVVDAFSKAVDEPLIIQMDPTRVRKSDRLHLLADISKLSAFLNWKPEVSLEKGIKTLIDSCIPESQSAFL